MALFYTLYTWLYSIHSIIYSIHSIHGPILYTLYISYTQMTLFYTLVTNSRHTASFYDPILSFNNSWLFLHEHWRLFVTFSVNKCPFGYLFCTCEDHWWPILYSQDSLVTHSFNCTISSCNILYHTSSWWAISTTLESNSGLRLYTSVCYERKCWTDKEALTPSREPDHCRPKPGALNKNSAMSWIRTPVSRLRDTSACLTAFCKCL